MRRSRVRLLILLLPILCTGAAAFARQTNEAEGLQAEVNQARKELAAAVRQGCLIEYDNPNRQAQLMSIGWETDAYCRCVESGLLATMNDELTKEVAVRIVRTQDGLKTLADLATLANEPHVAEYLRLTRNAKGRCLNAKMRP